MFGLKIKIVLILDAIHSLLRIYIYNLGRGLRWAEQQYGLSLNVDRSPV